MREIKFRAWDKDNKCWLSNSHFEDGELFINWDTSGNGQFYIHDKTQSGHTCIDLMQFTGLKDKNGKKIYEGDILSFKNPEPFLDMLYEVVFDSDVAAFAIHNFTKAIHTFFYEISTVEGCTVIGNIHENPELLEEQENGCMWRTT